MIIDFNTHVGSFPAYEKQTDEPELLQSMQEAGIGSAVVSDLGTAFGTGENSITGENLIRFYSLAPDFDPETLPGAEVKGIRIYPAYQTWDFSGEPFKNLLAKACDNHWVVQIYLRLLDPRVVEQTVGSQAVLDQIGEVIKGFPEVRFVISGATIWETQSNTELLRLENVWTDISHIQHPINALPKLVANLGSSRLLFGTNSPFFYPYVGVYRAENAGLAEADLARILSGNAQELL